MGISTTPHAEGGHRPTEARVAAPRTRRQVLAAAVAAAGGALATRALTVAEPVEAANGDVVRVGQSKTGTVITTITNTAASSTAVALKGVVSTKGAGRGTAGVWGASAAQNGKGVFGFATNTGGDTKGVAGRSTNGKGVYGQATATAGVNYGVYGTTASNGGVGVYGQGATGVQGKGTGYGFYGSGATGVLGSGTTGVSGVGTMYGVYGSSSAYGVVGSGTSYGGYFFGAVHVAGTLSKSGGTFLIDHPQDPANRTLAHSFVEAPEMLNIYRGTATLDSRGTATVRLPRYYEALNRDHHVQLTAAGGPAPSLHVAREVIDGRFAIGGGAPGQKVFWIVTGVRHDAWARKHPLRVERTKSRKDRGKYLNPEVHGQPMSAAMHPLPPTPPHRRQP